MPANPWQLRADVRPLEAAAERWSELAVLVARRGDELVEAARRATEGWDAAAAESFAEHRREVLANLDRFTALAEQVAGSLRAVSTILTSSQKELDRAWTTVAMVPHETVGEARHLVFRPSEDDDRGKVVRGQAETEEIRRRLTVSLDGEAARLRAARAELVTVRIELMTLTSGRFPGVLGPAREVSGVGSVPGASTSVRGAAQAGVGALPPIAPVSVSTPDLTGISSGGPGPLAAGAGAAAALRGAAARRSSGQAAPPIGGMGAGAMAARAGTMARGAAGGRSAAARTGVPRLERSTADEAAARVARDKEVVKEAKRAALEEKRAERAARRAEREAARENGRARESRRERAEEDPEEDPEEGVEEAGRRSLVEVVHEPAPDADQGGRRR
ncbi:hypothetical protein GCM10011376_01590 [Nocardioides flavus (ex Wang et al. 2016)]|uniref:PPE family protein n=1 Tax=Nocardioides flavus (ex Wang et al. 2016) TaxID=2058780 RepID=A0ABQ3HFP4_9ACTN|nr:hypothetical protein [Nocardioides flavus (ex Wang et al. 2016)]GHE15076.1 hypothetical protein GCM10011376_01590 [Nocardioides flavus (ex Wang et al. 2016)]